jgi:hypothetical protein
VAFLPVQHGSVRRSAARGDAGVLVLGTLARLILVVAIIGTIVYDGISMTTTHLSVRDDAQAAAQLGYEALRDKGTERAAYLAVLAYARDHGDAVIPAGFRVGANHSVTVELRRSAKTLVSSYLPKINGYVVATASATASDPVR